MSVQTTIAPGTVILRTFIPSRRQVPGLEYGAHASHDGYDCYYVRPKDTERWGLARDTSADDELEADIVAAIRAEIEAAA